MGDDSQRADREPVIRFPLPFNGVIVVSGSLASLVVATEQRPKGLGYLWLCGSSHTTLIAHDAHDARFICVPCRHCAVYERLLPLFSDTPHDRNLLLRRQSNSAVRVSNGI